MSITNYEEVENIAEQLLCFRTETDKLNDSEKEIYIKDFINEYLRDFKNPQENIHEYTDNIIRCLRLTKYIYIRGGGYYIDLEPRRRLEINAILSDLSG